MKRQFNSSFHANRLNGVAGIIRAGALAMLLGASSVIAQQSAVTPTSQPVTPATSPEMPISKAPASTTPTLMTPPAASKTATPPADDRYRIGPGDVLDVRVFNKPQLSISGARVDGNGMIRVPFVDEVQAACLTERELAKEIKTRLLKWQRDPQVDVIVTGFNSQAVSLIGEVRAPARFELRRRVRLLELLANANGQTERAAQTIQVLHTNGPTTSLCREAPVAGASDADPLENIMISYRLADVLAGKEEANPFVEPGDIITVPRADQVYLIGNVFRPGPMELKEPTTLSRALVMAGGVPAKTDRSKIKIIRQLPGSTTKQIITADLKAIEKNQAEDIALLANDIIEVPVQGGFKGFARDIVSSLVPSLAQTAGYLPYRVIY